MTSYCIHHPQKPSHWHCPLCKGEFCDTCAQKKTQNGLAVTRTIALCPRCNREMEWVGNINAITPFWKRLPRFFLYPFKVSVILFVVFLACLSSLLAKPTLTSGLLQFTSYALLVRYAYLVLRTTASGNLEPPDVGGFPLKSGIIIIFKQGVLFFLMGLIAAGSAALLGPSSLIFVFLIFALFFPAMMILLVSSNRVLHAINPVAFVRLALSMGKGYLGMFALLTILWGAPALVMKYLAPIMGFRTLQFSTFMISGYYMLVSYHLMGYVTLQYHRKIGYEIDVENFTAQTPPPVQSPPSEHQEQKSPHLQRITFLLKEGKMDEALKTLDRIRIEGAGLHHMDLAHKYFELLKMMKKDQEMCEFGREYIENLVKEKNKEKTLEVWTCCIQKEPGFLPSIQALYAIGMWVSDKESPEKGIAIFQRAIKAYPNDPMVPQFWFRSARILNDRLYRREKAMKLLEGIIKKYPDDKIRPQVENYLSTL